MIVQLQSYADFLTALGTTMKVNTQWGVTTPLGQVNRQIVVQNNTTTVSVPSGLFATMVFVIPPAANTQQWQLKGNAGDVGIPMAASQPAIFGLNPNQANPIIGIGLSAGVDQVFTLIWL
jgi:hypothetical protein